MAVQYSHILRVVEGEKALARRQSAFLKERDKVTNSGAKTFINTIIDIENQIIQDLKNLSLNYFERRNLLTILDQFKNRVSVMDQRLGGVLQSSQQLIIDRANFEVDRNMEIIGAGRRGYFAPYISEEVYSSLQIMSDIPLSDFTDSLKRETTNIIRQGMMRGEGVSAVIDRLQNRFEKSKNMGWHRADMIARMELLRASGMAIQTRGEQIAETLPEVRKKWIHYEKPGDRDGHEEAEKKYEKGPIKVNNKFRVRPYGRTTKYPSQKRNNKYEWCKYPRDPALSAANSVYCGCTVVYVNEDIKGEKV
jgi:hypothetical protein